ncbi:MAG: hypothetical protein C5B48_14650 [Candidatus Rokuibacteriota bacterium]|nr:MAG: hypothetical protein C5B48_14650 [Candidatus Rokubacteria bacterium]
MRFRRSFGWVAVVLAVPAGGFMLATALGQWHVRSLDEQGRMLVTEGQYQAAVRVLSHAVAEAPRDAFAHYYLGLAYAGIGLTGAAHIHFDEAARLAPARGLRFGPPRRRRPMRRVTGQFDLAVHRDRTGGAFT